MSPETPRGNEAEAPALADEAEAPAPADAAEAPAPADAAEAPAPADAAEAPAPADAASVLDPHGPEVDELVRSMGLIFANSFMYGREHGVTKKATSDSFDVLTRVMTTYERVTFAIADDDLLINGHVFPQKNPLVQKFARYLIDLELSSLALTRGMDRADFDSLIEIMNTSPEELLKAGGVGSVISGSGLSHVGTKSVVYREIAEDDVVLTKDEFEGLDEGGGEAVLAFLKGDVSEDDENVLRSIQDMASDADKLTELILRAAEVQAESADVEGGETFANLVVGCLRRAYEGILQDPALKTQRGKKELTKTLMLVEKQLLDKMRDSGHEVEGAMVDVVTDAVEGMTDELKMDSLAAEYVKKRGAVETSEDRILRYIRSKGSDERGQEELKEKLLEGGLSEAGWRELVVRSGSEESNAGGDASGGEPGAGGGGFSSEGMAAIGALTGLLSSLEAGIQGKGPGGTGTGPGGDGTGPGGDGTGPGGDGTGPGGAGVGADVAVGKTVVEIEGEVANLASIAGRRIEDFVSIIGEVAAETAPPRDRAEARERKQKRENAHQKLMVLLAEIGQELCQPLAVINCALDMISAGSLGPVTDGQKEMLNLAVSSGDKLKQLADKMIEISGVPTTMAPDAAIQASLYGG